MELTGLAISVFMRLAPQALRWSKGSVLEQSVRATAAQFSQFESLKASLIRWCDDARVAAEFQRAHEGQTRDVDLHRLTEVLLDHDFPGTGDPPTEARKVVETFFAILESKLLQDPTEAGRFIYGELREHDARTEQQATQILELIQQIDRKVSTSPHAVTVPEGESNTPLDAQIDLVRQRLLTGHPKQALELLDTIEHDLDRKTLVPRVVFRLVTNRAACYFELGRVGEALAGFEAAYQLQPQDPKATANLALVHLIRGQIVEAKTLARKALESDPKRCDGLTILAQAMERDGEADAAIQLLSPYSKDPGCRTALALLYVNAERWEDVHVILERVPATDRSFQEVLFLGEAYVKVAERQVKSVSPLLSDMPAEMLTRLKSLEDLLGPVVDAARQEASSVLLPALTLRASARLMTERQADGIADLEEASGIEKAPETVLRNLALAYMVQEEPAKAVATFRDALARFPSKDEELRPLLVEALIAAQHIPEAVEEGRLAWDRAQSAGGRRDAGLSYAVALAGSGNGPEAERIVLSLREANPGDSEIELRWAEALVRLGRDADAIPILEAQSRSADGGIKALADIYLGDAYGRSERFDDAATAYRPIAHPIDSPVTFHRYLLALYRSGRWAEALESIEKARQLRGDTLPPLSEAEIQGQILEELGDLARARTLYERIIGADKSAWYFHLGLARVLFRQDEVTLAKRAVDVAAEAQNRSPRDLLRIAQVYAALGEHAAALKYGYEAVRGDTGDPDIALGFIGIVLAMPEDARIELDQPAAQPSSVVEFESNGQTHEFVLLEPGEHPVHAGELKPDDPLAIKLVGGHVGERIVLDDRPLSRREAVIQSVRHRYVAVFQATLKRFAVRHPGHPGLVAAPVREDFHEQVKFLVRSRHETVHKLFEIYTQHPLTVGAVADRCGETTFETLLALAHEPNTPIVSRMQGLEETALTVLSEAEAMVLDPTALAALALLELVDMPVRLGTRILVPQEFLDQLQNEILHRRLSEGREHISLRVEGDQIVKQVVSAEESARATQILSGIREKCKAFDVVPRPVTPGRWSDWADRGLFGADSADTIAIARSTGAVLVSADARLLGAVANDYGIKVCAVYDLINYFKRKGLLSEEAFENAVAAMVWHGFEHTPIRASTLLRTLRSTGYEHSAKFERLLDVLSNPTTDIESAVRVVTNFLGAVNQLPVIPPNVESIVRRVLERLARGEDVTKVRAVRQVASGAALPKWLKKLVAKCADQVERDVTKGQIVRS